MGNKQLHLLRLLAGRLAHTGRGSIGIIREALTELPQVSEADAILRADAVESCSVLHELFESLSISSSDFRNTKDELSLFTFLKEQKEGLERLGLRVLLPEAEQTITHRLSTQALLYAIKAWHRYASLYLTQAPSATLSVSLSGPESQTLELNTEPISERSSARLKDVKTPSDLLELDHRWETVHLFSLISAAEVHDASLSLRCHKQRLSFSLEFLK